MERVALVDERLKVRRLLGSVRGGEGCYHEESPCGVVKEDCGCYDEHHQADEFVELGERVS